MSVQIINNLIILFYFFYSFKQNQFPNTNVIFCYLTNKTLKSSLIKKKNVSFIFKKLKLYKKKTIYNLCIYNETFPVIFDYANLTTFFFLKQPLQSFLFNIKFFTLGNIYILFLIKKLTTTSRFLFYIFFVYNQRYFSTYDNLSSILFLDTLTYLID